MYPTSKIFKVFSVAIFFLLTKLKAIILMTVEKNFINPVKDFRMEITG